MSSQGTFIAAGNLPRFTFTFTNLAGVLTNPTTVTVKLCDPNGTISTLTAVNDSTGVYHADATAALTVSGDWVIQATGSGALVAAIEQHFTVEPSVFY